MKKFIIRSGIQGEKEFEGLVDDYKESVVKVEKYMQKEFPNNFVVLSLPDECFQIWTTEKDGRQHTIGYKFNYEQVTSIEYILNLLEMQRRISITENLLQKIDEYEIEKRNQLIKDNAEYKRYIKDKYISADGRGMWIKKGRDRVLRRF